MLTATEPNWELPAKTKIAMASTSGMRIPEVAMATPVIKPQAAMPGATVSISIKPWR
jgi:hypothetical protein